MRTKDEHISSQIRRIGKRFARFARAAMARVRQVLKRVRGGVRHRHLAVGCLSAPPAPRRVNLDKAALIGLPAGVLRLNGASNQLKTMQLLAVANLPMRSAHPKSSRVWRQHPSVMSVFGRADDLGAAGANGLPLARSARP